MALFHFFFWLVNHYLFGGSESMGSSKSSTSWVTTGQMDREESPATSVAKGGGRQRAAVAALWYLNIAIENGQVLEDYHSYVFYNHS